MSGIPFPPLRYKQLIPETRRQQQNTKTQGKLLRLSRLYRLTSYIGLYNKVLLEKLKITQHSTNANKNY